VELLLHKVDGLALIPFAHQTKRSMNLAGYPLIEGVYADMRSITELMRMNGKAT
jgi:hypothetical protein